MRICDRTWALTGKAVKAEHEITIDNQVFHLCIEQFQEVLDFVVNPTKPSPLEKIKKTLHLPGKSRQTREKVPLS